MNEKRKNRDGQTEKETFDGVQNAHGLFYPQPLYFASTSIAFMA